MIKIKIWDKKESINGVSAEDFIKNSPAWFINGDILLIIDDNSGLVQQVENINQLRAQLKLDESISSEDVGKAYLESISTAS
ncbi:hypothetical protein [Clostridium sp. YIM B02569]|uniref:hypothetical protein n=1 Tax=Clostridium sp. YIM B02569 TaxID=2911967 RepID=UPI001EEDE41E|nr:hypothetical protein [Clostridium sp. YIM B02569]